jgi:hypothetical protein
LVEAQFYLVESGFRVAGVGHAELAVGLVDPVIEGREVVGFGDLYDEALEVFGGVVGGGDGEETSYAFYPCYCELGLIAELKDGSRNQLSKGKVKRND